MLIILRVISLNMMPWKRIMVSSHLIPQKIGVSPIYVGLWIYLLQISSVLDSSFIQNFAENDSAVLKMFLKTYIGELLWSHLAFW